MIAALCATAYYYAYWRFRLSPPPRDLLTVVVSVCAIAVGFVATAKSILLTIQERTVIRFFRDSNRYATLVNYFMAAVYWSFLCAGLSAFGLLFDLPKLNWWVGRVGATLWVLLVAGSTLTYFRVLHIFGLILRSQAQEQ